MPRRPRVHYSHATYHVMLQGNYKQNIFFDDSDYLEFYRLLERVTQQYNCKIHLFCLMTNHVHLVIQIKYIPLSKIMQNISSSFTRYINKKFNKNGHLFRGRYRDKLVQDDRYFLELCYYIHKNPLSAKMVTDLDCYSWSSHHQYAKNDKLSWVTTSQVEKLFKKYIDSSEGYKDFILDRDSVYEKPTSCILDENGMLTLTDTVKLALESRNEINLSHFSTDEIINIVCDHMQVSLSSLRSASRRHDVVMARMVATLFAHYYGKKRLTDIAFYLMHTPDGLSKTMHRHFTSENKRGKIKPVVDQLERAYMKLIKEK